jgi:GT2 family glycosyltransferase
VRGSGFARAALDRLGGGPFGRDTERLSTVRERTQHVPTNPTGAVPLVSVVVPVLNGERFLRESLDSILAQTYPELEVIVLDDGSTDRTAEIATSYGDAIRYRRQPQTRGIYGNANDGIALARGEFVAVYHADDVYLPTIVEREVAFLRAHPEVGAVFTSDVFIDETGREIGRLELPPEVRGGHPLGYATVINALLKYKNPFLRVPSSMVRASVHAEVGVYRDEQFKNTSDLDMWLRILRRYPIAILEEHLYLYRRGHGSSSERYHHLRTEPERFFRIMDLELASGGLDVATADALAAYEAHRAQDRLMLAVSSYVKGGSGAARSALRAVGGRALMQSSQVRRGRLLVLLALLHMLVRLPRVSVLARLFHRRWHLAGRSKKATRLPTPAGGA